MSATVDSERFAAYFNGCPVLTAQVGGCGASPGMGIQTVDNVSVWCDVGVGVGLGVAATATMVWSSIS
eukprot:145965-Chlamydomonas_euryale.AAC.1